MPLRKQISVSTPDAAKVENKADTTTRVAKEITDKEVALREGKSQRLKAARLAKEKSAPPVKAQAHRKKRVPSG